MWLVLMLIAFLFNGLSAFGVRVLAGLGLSARYTYQYLLFFYLSGFIFIAIFLVVKGIRPNPTEMRMGALMALCSISGTASMSYALGTYNIPGNITFPISNGGSLFVVVAAGFLMFRERLGWYGIGGVILGTLAVILLSLS